MARIVRPTGTLTQLAAFFLAILFACVDASRASACITAKTLYTTIPKSMLEALEGASDIRISRQWWGKSKTPPKKAEPRLASVSGPEKAAVIAALATIKDNSATPGRVLKNWSGFPVTPYRIEATHNGKTEVLMICFDCADAGTAIARHGADRIGILPSARAALDAVLAKHGKPSPPPDAAEIAERNEALAAKKAEAAAQAAPTIAPTMQSDGKGGFVLVAPQGAPTRSSARTGCGPQTGW